MAENQNSRLTLDVIGPVAMGRDFQSLVNKENRIADSFLKILEPSREKLLFVLVNFLLPQWFARRIPWRLNKMVEQESGVLRAVCHDIVQEKRDALKSRKAHSEELDADILGTIMLRGEFSDDQLVDQMLTFLAAGVRLFFLYSFFSFIHFQSNLLFTCTDRI